MGRLPPAAQEDLRLRVVHALESGWVRTYGQAAQMFGVSERSDSHTSGPTVSPWTITGVWPHL